MDIASSGGFTAVVALRLRTSPASAGAMTVLSLRGPSGSHLVEGQLGAFAGSQPSFRFTDASGRDYLTTSADVATATWLVLAFHYVHSSSEWSIYVDGVQEGNSAQADVRS